MAFAANVGGKPKEDKIKKISFSTKLVIFICLLTGTIIWMGYRASITSELATTKIKYPFDSLETLLGTSFT